MFLLAEKSPSPAAQRASPSQQFGLLWLKLSENRPETPDITILFYLEISPKPREKRDNWPETLRGKPSREQKAGPNYSSNMKPTLCMSYMLLHETAQTAIQNEHPDVGMCVLHTRMQ